MPKYGDIQTKKQSKALFSLDNTKQSTIKMVANNPEQEEAEEEVSVNYSGEDLEIGFNVSYLIDVLNVISSPEVRITLSNSNSSALVSGAADSGAVYVVMPMRL